MHGIGSRRIVGMAAVLGAVLIAQAATAPGAWAQADAAARCAALQALNLEGLASGPTRIVSARLVKVGAEGLAQPSRPMNQTINPKAVGEYCEVRGYVAPQHQFELRLPMAAEWNGKFFFHACAGFCGTVNGTFCNAGLAFGYASVTSNGGHFSAPGFDGLWAANDPDAQEDFAYRGNHAVTVASKKIVETYYGTPAKRSYMAGCSKGGQATLIEIQRYPNEYDGVVVVAPVYDYTGKSIIHGSWIAQANHDGKGGLVLDDAATALVHKAVVAACDETDGVKDGIVGDPLSCTWKPADLLCKPGAAAGTCLSAAQVAALTKIYAAPTDSTGKRIFPTGNTLGAEMAEWNAWVNGIRMGPGPLGRSVNYSVAQQFLRYLAFEKVASEAESDPLAFNFDRDPAKLARSRALYDSSSADLRAFKARGGKVLMWHGWADTGIPAQSSIDYVLRVMKVMGSREETESFLRLYLLPGVFHCAGGPGADQVDALALLDAWVERGTAPDMIVSTKTDNGQVTRTRPVYPFPKVARFKGTGSPEDPANFEGVDPWPKGAAIPAPAGVYD